MTRFAWIGELLTPVFSFGKTFSRLSADVVADVQVLDMIAVFVGCSSRFLIDYRNWLFERSGENLDTKCCLYYH